MRHVAAAVEAAQHFGGQRCLAGSVQHDSRTMRIRRASSRASKTIGRDVTETTSVEPDMRFVAFDVHSTSGGTKGIVKKLATR